MLIAWDTMYIHSLYTHITLSLYKHVQLFLLPLYIICYVLDYCIHTVSLAIMYTLCTLHNFTVINSIGYYMLQFCLVQFIMDLIVRLRHLAVFYRTSLLCVIFVLRSTTRREGILIRVLKQCTL